MKYNELDKVKIILTGESGVIIDKYKVDGINYYQNELDIKTDDRDVIEVSEADIVKVTPN